MGFFDYIFNLCCGKFDHKKEGELEIVDKTEVDNIKFLAISNSKNTGTSYDFFGNNNTTSSQEQVIKIDTESLSQKESLYRIDEVSEYSSNAGIGNMNNSYYSLNQSRVYSPRAYAFGKKKSKSKGKN